MVGWGCEGGMERARVFVSACVCDDTAEVEDGGAASSCECGRP